jgi:presenilin-like A22 family membrane protease
MFLFIQVFVHFIAFEFFCCHKNKKLIIKGYIVLTYSALRTRYLQLDSTFQTVSILTPYILGSLGGIVVQICKDGKELWEWLTNKQISEHLRPYLMKH